MVHLNANSRFAKNPTRPGITPDDSLKLLIKRGAGVDAQRSSVSQQTRTLLADEPESLASTTTGGDEYRANAQSESRQMPEAVKRLNSSNVLLSLTADEMREILRKRHANIVQLMEKKKLEQEQQQHSSSLTSLADGSSSTNAGAGSITRKQVYGNKKRGNLLRTVNDRKKKEEPPATTPLTANNLNHGQTNNKAAPKRGLPITKRPPTPYRWRDPIQEDTDDNNDNDNDNFNSIDTDTDTDLDTETDTDTDTDKESSSLTAGSTIELESSMSTLGTLDTLDTDEMERFLARKDEDSIVSKGSQDVHQSSINPCTVALSCLDQIGSSVQYMLCCQTNSGDKKDYNLDVLDDLDDIIIDTVESLRETCSFSSLRDPISKEKSVKFCEAVEISGSTSDSTDGETMNAVDGTGTSTGTGIGTSATSTTINASTEKPEIKPALRRGKHTKEFFEERANSNPSIENPSVKNPSIKNPSAVVTSKSSDSTTISQSARKNTIPLISKKAKEKAKAKEQWEQSKEQSKEKSKEKLKSSKANAPNTNKKKKRRKSLELSVVTVKRTDENAHSSNSIPLITKAKEKDKHNKGAKSSKGRKMRGRKK